MKKIVVLLLAIIFLVGCSKGNKPENSISTTEIGKSMDSVQQEATTDTQVTDTGTSVIPAPERLVIDPNSLRALASDKGMLLGGAISLNYFNEEKYVNTIKNEYNIFTLENMMKWSSINPRRETFIFSGSDVAVKFAEDNGMQMRGHTLVWHSQLPYWLTDGKWSKEELLNILDNYIDQMVGHFKGKINTWDVLNEILEEDGSFRQSMWYKTTGEDYIRLALNKAHEVDPDAKLVINDFNVETINPKSDGLYALVKMLQEEGVPIDGVGFQCHFISDQIDYDSFSKNIERFEALGLEVQLTEVDLRIKAPITEEKITAQGEAYKTLMAICLAHNIRVFVLWGVSDNHSWVPGYFVGYGSALLFDAKYLPKPGYYGIMDALKEHRGNDTGSN